jgi:hypothetical protein
LPIASSSTSNPLGYFLTGVLSFFEAFPASAVGVLTGVFSAAFPLSLGSGVLATCSSLPGDLVLFFFFFFFFPSAEVGASAAGVDAGAGTGVPSPLLQEVLIRKEPSRRTPNDLTS